MAPFVHGLEEKFGDQMQFTYLDIDDPDTEPFKKALGYVGTPQFLLLDGNGEIITQWFGLVDPVELEKALNEALAD
jgi:hypothetical protein